MIKVIAKKIIINAMWAILGRSTLVRFSRFLSNESRLDCVNNMETNGEKLVQDHLIKSRRSEPLILLDVGANVGMWLHSLLSKPLFSETVTVHAFEPCAGTAQTLTGNIETWGISHLVAVHQMALSDRTGHATLYSAGVNQGTNSLHVTDSTPPPTAEKVGTNTIDHFCESARITRITFVKIDTEGHDMAVIQGAEQMLRKHQIDSIQFEYNHRWVFSRKYLRDAFELLTPLGYAIGKITPRGIEFYKQWEPELETFREANFLAVLPHIEPCLPQIKWWNYD